MFIPPFFPEPIEVAGNVTSRSYDERLAFIRRLTGWSFAFVSLATMVALWMPAPTTGEWAGASLVALALLHAVLRKLNRWPSTYLALAPAMAVSWGWTGAWLHGLGWPVLALPLAVAGAALYVLISGRDFSFMGQFLLGSLAMGLGWVALAEAGWARGPLVGWGWVIGLAFTGYLTYDQAMILKRRRPEEVGASVCDLTSDLFNWISYGGRVWAHWRRFKW